MVTVNPDCGRFNSEEDIIIIIGMSHYRNSNGTGPRGMSIRPADESSRDSVSVTLLPFLKTLQQYVNYLCCVT